MYFLKLTFYINPVEVAVTHQMEQKMCNPCTSWNLRHDVWQSFSAIWPLPCPCRMVLAVACQSEEDREGDVGLQVTVSFGEKAVLRNARLEGKWGPSENALSYFPFTAGEPFKVHSGFEALPQWWMHWQTSTWWKHGFTAVLLEKSVCLPFILFGWMSFFHYSVSFII